MGTGVPGWEKPTRSCPLLGTGSSRGSPKHGCLLVLVVINTLLLPHRWNLRSPRPPCCPCTSLSPWSTTTSRRRVSRSWCAPAPLVSTPATWRWPPSPSAWGPASPAPASTWRASSGRRRRTVSGGSLLSSIPVQRAVVILFFLCPRALALPGRCAAIWVVGTEELCGSSSRAVRRREWQAKTCVSLRAALARRPDSGRKSQLPFPCLSARADLLLEVPEERPRQPEWELDRVDFISAWQPAGLSQKRSNPGRQQQSPAGLKNPGGAFKIDSTGDQALVSSAKPIEPFSAGARLICTQLALLSQPL